MTCRPSGPLMSTKINQRQKPSWDIRLKWFCSQFDGQAFL